MLLFLVNLEHNERKIVWIARLMKIGLGGHPADSRLELPASNLRGFKTPKLRRLFSAVGGLSSGAGWPNSNIPGKPRRFKFSTPPIYCKPPN
jgi:hypothetical protein